MDIQSHNITVADVKLKSWQREIVGTTIMFSSVLNLHQPKKQLPEKGILDSNIKISFPKLILALYCFLFAVKNLIPVSSLDSLMQWGRRHYGYLFDNPSLQQKSQSVFDQQKFCMSVHYFALFFVEIVNFLTSCDLGKEALIHFRAKVLSLISDRVVLVADEPGIEIHLYL